MEQKIFNWKELKKMNFEEGMNYLAMFNMYPTMGNVENDVKIIAFGHTSVESEIFCQITDKAIVWDKLENAVLKTVITVEEYKQLCALANLSAEHCKLVANGKVAPGDTIEFNRSFGQCWEKLKELKVPHWTWHQAQLVGYGCTEQKHILSHLYKRLKEQNVSIIK